MAGLVDLLHRRIWLGPLAAAILGIAIGLPVGWMTVNWQPGPDDVASIVDSYSLNNNLALARARLHGLSKSDLTRILADLIRQSDAANQTSQTERLNQFAAAMGISVSPSAAATAAASSTNGSGAISPRDLSLIAIFLPFVLIFFLAALLAAALLVFFLRILPGLRARPRIRESSPMPERRAPPKPIPQQVPVPPSPAPSSGQLIKSNAKRRERAVPPSPTPSGQLGRFVATFSIGNDNYDTSFSLETAQQDFMGECGMGISETIGEGRPDKVTALDVWLFDKADVHTETLVVMSEYAYKDETLRGKLAIKGTAILAAKGKLISLDTQSLHLDGRITEVVYAKNVTLPAYSHFEKLTVEIVPSLREVVPA
ncbi:MAG: hypothetical protein M1570_01580 [Chloroflexi bacterium]|nr:hypothetical protein [Chloroflexota bacterium]